MQSEQDQALNDLKKTGGWKSGVLAPVVLLCLNLFIFGTATVYYGNQGEFLVEDEDVLLLLLLPATVIALVLTLMGWLASRRFLWTTAAVWYFLAFVTYVHGNLVRWSTGVLDGAALDMGNTIAVLADSVIWLLLGWLVWHFRAWLVVHGWKLCVLLGLFQLVGALDIKHQSKTGNREMKEVPSELYSFNDGPNVLHIILDGFQGNVFESVLDRNPQFAERWQGFVHFRDALTPSAVTYLSVPATLSGKAFDNSISITQYHDETLGGENLYTLLHDNGYAVDIASPLWWNLKRDFFASYYPVPVPFASLEETIRSTAWYLFDLSLFRQVPYWLKSTIYRNGAWRFSSQFAAHPEQQFQHFAHSAFMRDLAAKARVGRATPTYKVIHLISPHAPLVSNAECGYTGRELYVSEESFFNQSRCTVIEVDRLFDRLKALGIYDDMLILVHGDHGGGIAFEMIAEDGELTSSSVALENLWGNPLPLVLVKKPAARGPLQVSDRNVSLIDYPATVADVLKLEHDFLGQSMFSTLTPPARRMHYTSTQHRNAAAEKDRFANFTSFAVDGSIFRVASWSKIGIFQASATELSGQYEWGTPLTFGRSGSFKAFGDGGWTVTRGGDVNWTQGKVSGLLLPVSATSGDVRLSFTVRPLLVPGKLEMQRVGIEVNGQRVADLELTEDRFKTYRVEIPGELLTGEEIALKFLLPDAASPESLESGEDRRPLALAFFKVQLDPQAL